MKTNKLASLILLFCIISRLFISVSAEENSASTQGNQAMEVLVAAGAFAENENFGGEEMSRGVFTRLIMKLGGYTAENTVGSDEIFSDVSVLDENCLYINAAYAMGYISKNADGMFYPDDIINCAEAVKLVIGVLGYGIYAEQTGGYPVGYMTAANRLKLLYGLNLSADDVLTKDAAFCLLKNAAQTELLEFTQFGDNVKMQSYPGKTLLTERFSVYDTEAIIEANEYTDLLTPDSDLKEGHVLADGVKYSVGKTAAASYLGMNMKLYYFDAGDGAVPELRYIEPYKSKNNVVELDAKDVLGLTNSEDGFNYAEANGKTRTLKFSDTVYLIWNGKMAKFSAEKLVPKVGTVTLISNDGDAKVDVVKVMSYDTYVVTAVSGGSGGVSTKQGETLWLDKEDNAYFLNIVSGGASAEIKNISVNSVLSYAYSEEFGKPLKTVIVSDKKVSGNINEVKSKDKKAVIDGKVYNIADEIADSVTPGRDGTFYLDMFDRIVYIDGALDIVYGYLKGLAVEMFDEVKCRIFTENNRWVTLKMNDKVNFNGNRISAVKVAEDLGKSPTEYRQLIRYFVNSQGKISQIETAKPITMGSDEDRLAIENDTFRLSSSGYANYRTSNQTFNGFVSINADSKFFAIPEQIDGSEENEFAVLTRDSLQQDMSYSYEAYDADLYRTSSIFVIKNYSQKVSNSGSIGDMMLITDFGTMLNEEREAVPAMIGYLLGMSISLPVKLDSKFATSTSVKSIGELHPGDIVQFAYSQSGEVNVIERRYEAGSKFSLSTSNAYNSASFVGGKAVAVNRAGNRMIIQYRDNGESSIYATSNVKNVYIYERERKKFTVGTMEDILDGDWVFTGARYLVLRELFVIRD